MAKNKIEINQQKVNLDQRALITNQAGDILLVRATDMDWDLPGGLYTSASTYKESLEQELEETLGLKVMTENPFFASDYINPDTGEVTITHIIKCQVFTDEYSDEKYAEVKWVSTDEIAEISFSTFAINDAVTEFLKN